MHPRCLPLLLRALLAFGLVIGSTLGPSAEGALAGTGDVTSTTVTCSGLRVQSPSTATSCTATVANVTSGGTHAPTGSVAWSIASGGGSLGSTSCALAGSGLVTSCSVTYTTPAGAAVPVLKAAYSGAASVAASTGVGELGVCPGGGRPSISIDGNNTDWGCVSALFGDDPSDAGGGSGDLTFLALSADGINLYVRWDEFLTSNANSLTNDGFSVALDTRGGSTPNYLAWVLVQPGATTAEVQQIGGATTVVGTAHYTCDYTTCANGQSVSIEASFPLTAFGVSSGQTVGIQGQTRASASTNSNVKDCIPGKTDCSGGAFLINTATGAVTVNSGDTTATAVACSPNPASVGVSTTCTASVTDTTLSGTQAAGLITWSDNAGGTFAATSCSLSSGGCSVTYTPASSGSATITAVYSGNTQGSQVLGSSSGSAVLTVADAAGATPTATPTASPTPTAAPTSTPTSVPVVTDTPTPAPTATPTSTPSSVPTSTPTTAPTSTATTAPTTAPTSTPVASDTPTAVPTSTPTTAPTSTATAAPTSTPTSVPTSTATPLPTSTPTSVPNTATALPTSTPSSPAPSQPAPPAPTVAATVPPTSTPTPRPTNTPTAVPTSTPTSTPTNTPTATPTSSPTSSPSPLAASTAVATASASLSLTLTPASTPSATPTSTPIVFGSLTGQVTDAQTGLALGGAAVQVQNTATAGVQTATTAPDGRYTLDGLAEGSYVLTFAAPGYVTATSSGVVTPNAAGAVDQALTTSAPACAPSSGPRTIAPEIARKVEVPGELYYTSEFDCFWTSGSVTLSADPMGGLPFDVDDALELEVQRPDGSLAAWSFDFSNACTVVTDADPQDVSTLFQPGVNHIWLRLYDQCGTDSGNSPLYLSAPSPVSDEPPASVDDLAAVLPVGDQDRDTSRG